MSEPTRRLFIGLLPDEDVRAALAAHQQRWYWRAGSLPTRAARLHLTLHFLGEVDAEAERELGSVLRGEDVAPFDLVLRVAESWSGGIAVVRPDEHPALLDLHRRLADRLLLTGLTAQRDNWVPHVTLARAAFGAAPPEAIAPIGWTVRSFVLVWSRPGPPAQYEELQRFGAG